MDALIFVFLNLKSRVFEMHKAGSNATGLVFLL